MAGVAMPDEGQLPPGPERELTAAIHELYLAAGRPGIHKLSTAVQARDDLRDSISHETVRAILRGQKSSWGKVECLVRLLAEWSVQRPDVAATVRLVQKLWHAANGPAPEISVAPASPELLRQAIRGLHRPTHDDVLTALPRTVLYVPKAGERGFPVAATRGEGLWLCAFTSLDRLRAHQRETQPGWTGGSARLTGAELVRAVCALDLAVGLLVDPATAPGSDPAETLPVPHAVLVELMGSL